MLNYAFEVDAVRQHTVSYSVRAHASQRSVRFNSVHIFLAAQSANKLKTGQRDKPLSVKLYSTLGGTSGCTFLLTKPSRSRSLNCEVNTFWETSGIERWRSLNLIASAWLRLNRIKSFHFPEIFSNNGGSGHFLLIIEVGL